ncbi:MAG: ATP synthase F1 subunit delta [Candidatus Omnitrophota bacterium]
MAIDPAVVKNYTHALLGVVKKEKIPLEASLEEALSLRRAIEENVKLGYFLEGPQFREADKHKFVNSVFSGQLSTVFFQFLHLLLKHNRIDHLHAILDHYEEMVEKEQGLTIGAVTTAVPLSEEQQRTMREKLETFCGKKFDLRFKVDAELIGGVKVQYGDTLMDTTISSYLNEIHRRLNQIRIAAQR